MADHPGAKQVTTVDRTSALVAGGLVILAVVGVATIFSETIAAAWSPAASASAEQAAPAPRARAGAQTDSQSNLHSNLKTGSPTATPADIPAMAPAPAPPAGNAGPSP